MAKGTIRQTFTLHSDTWDRLRAFRHSQQIDRMTDAIETVLRAGLAALEAQYGPSGDPPNNHQRKPRK